MKDSLLKEIECTSVAKEKNRECSEAIEEFVSSLTLSQLKKYWKVENIISDYNIYIQDEIFKRLL